MEIHDMMQTPEEDRAFDFRILLERREKAKNLFT